MAEADNSFKLSIIEATSSFLNSLSPSVYVSKLINSRLFDAESSIKSLKIRLKNSARNGVARHLKRLPLTPGISGNLEVERQRKRTQRLLGRPNA